MVGMTTKILECRADSEKCSHKKPAQLKKVSRGHVRYQTRLFRQSARCDITQNSIRSDPLLPEKPDREFLLTHISLVWE
jgi:hypothetical protein